MKDQPIFCCECATDVSAVLISGEEVNPHRPDLFALPLRQCKKCKMKSAMEWKPIKTAPRLGRILLTNGSHVGEGHFYSLENRFVYDGLMVNPWNLSGPTHWMPLPRPPIT